MIDNLISIEEKIWNSVQNETKIGLLDGLSGIALFYKFLIDVYSNEKYNERLLIVIDKINTLLSKENYGFSFCSGLSGFGWVLINCESINIEIEEDYFEDIDLILQEELIEQSSKNNYDFLHGSMGIAMYFIERCKKNKNNKLSDLLNDFVKNLNNKILFNIQDLLTRKPGFIDEKHIFFGIAHGVSGYMNFLTHLNKNFIDLKVDIKEAVRTCLNYLQFHKEYNNLSKQFYPHTFYLESNIINPAIFGWCQGDLGVANSLHNVAMFLNDDSLKKEAKELVEFSKNITFNDSGIKDFGICHGSTGIVLQYLLSSKIQKINNEQQIQEWFEQVKKQTKNFKVYESHQGYDEYEIDMCLLSGAAGLGMTILSTDHKIDLKWLEALNLY